MIEKGSRNSDVFAKVHDFLVAENSGELTREGWVEFERYLEENDDACRVYAQYVGVSVLLPSILAAVSKEDESLLGTTFVSESPDLMVHDVPRSLGSIWQGVASYSSSNWPFAYFVATVILAIGLTIAAFTGISPPVQVVKDTRPESTQSRTPFSLAVVGRITGMVDCRWEKGARFRALPSEDPSPKSLVSLGDTFAMTSGLMEITYSTGAKVILQGPVTYQVDSAASGYLSVGKLTARLEKKSEAPANQKLFSITTPTAIVTDLGTEFGVDVDEQGWTQSHVFRGAVELTSASDREKKHAEVLHAGQSACVEKSTDATGASITVIRRAVVDAKRFARGVARRDENAPPGQQVLAWFRMGEDDPDAVAGRPADKQIRDHKGYVHLNKFGSPKYSADTAVPGSSLAMSFNGGSDANCIGCARFPYVITDYFILESWVRLRKTSDYVQSIVHCGDANGYGLCAINGTWQCVFENVGMCKSGVACELDKWTHVAVVCERGRSQLWVNGKAVGEAIDAIPNAPDGPFGIGALYPRRLCAFNGDIDEVRLSTFVAPFRPAMLLLSKAEQPQRRSNESDQTRAQKAK
jgi:hypothetical protein